MLKGRKTIYTSAQAIGPGNVVYEVSRALMTHMENCVDIEYLKEYRKGIMPVLEKTKEIRSEINHRVVVNNADRCVTFKNGYFMTKPAEYVSRRESEDVSGMVKQFNEFKYLSGKNDVDNEIIDSFHTCGIGVLYITPRGGNEERPYKAYSLDPQKAFVAYSMDVGNDPVFACNMVVRNDRMTIDCMTRDSVYRLDGGPYSEYSRNPGVIADVMSVVAVEPNPLGEIGIVEYYANEDRLGGFELGISIQDAINMVQSLRMDGVDQFIQSLAVATNCELPEGTTANDIRRAGMIVLKSVGENKASFDIKSEQLDQTQSQVLIDNLTDQFNDVCALPSTNRNGGGSSDNGGAVYLREGYAQADTYARTTTDCFLKCNREFDRIALKICRGFGLLGKLRMSDFELKIEGNSTANLLAKSQAGLNMKMLGMAPEIVYERTGISSDPHKDVEMSRKYIDLFWTPGNGGISVSSTQESGQQEGESDSVKRVDSK